MNRIHPVACSLVAALCLHLFAGDIHSQPGAQQPKNLKFFPANTPREELISIMRNFSFALGVPCTHCHGTEQQTTSDLTGVDFSLDLKPTKEKARAMLRMTEEINSRLLAAISPRSELELKASCFTCHSGIPLPEMIEARILRIIESQGIEAAVEDYRGLRSRYYGTAAYNFRPLPLSEVTDELRRAGKFREAAEISLLNLEFHQDERYPKFQLAEAYFAMGETGKAESVYQELVEIERYRERAQKRLEQLRKPRD